MGLVNFGKCPRCGQQHSQFEVKTFMRPGTTHGPDHVIEGFTCCSCGVIVQRKHKIESAVIELEVTCDDAGEHITIDNRKPSLPIIPIDEA